MQTIRRTVTWMLLLTVAGAAVGGTYVWKLLGRSDQIVREELQRALAEKVPDWDVSFDDIRLELGTATARLMDVTLGVRGREGPLIHVPQLVAQLDRDLLAQEQIVRIEHVALHEPTVWVSRDEAGRWNWQELTPPPPSDTPCPEIEIIRGTVVVHSSRTRQLPETQFSCREVNGWLAPSGHRRLAIRIMTDVDHAGSLSVTGSVDLTTRAWKLIGEIAALDTQEGALGVAAGLSPDLRAQMSALSERDGVPARLDELPQVPVTRPLPGASDSPAVVPAAARTTHSEFALPELGVEAQLDLRFEIGRAGTEAPLEYSVAATIHEGAIVNPALPIPLYQLRGRVQASHREVVIEDLSAANGDTQLRISGRLERRADGWAKEFSVHAANLELDRRIRDYLHNESWRRMYDQIQPAGRFNLDVRVAHDGGANWDVRLNDFTAQNCSLMHEAFQYPITGIVGSIRQNGDEFQIQMDGYAGERPVALRGSIRHPGPEMEAEFQITATDFPIDQRVIDALQLPKYHAVRRALELLRLRGLADVQAALRRPAGPGNKFGLTLHVDVRDAVLSYAQFPYELTGVRGKISFDPSIEPIWHFQNLEGRHGSTTITGRAKYDLHNPPGQLELVLAAKAAPIDQHLHRACITATPALGRIWEELNPSGMLDDLVLELLWKPGGRPNVRLPLVNLSKGRIRLKALPYAWENVNAAFSWSDSTAVIRSTLSAQHDGTTLEIVGGMNPAAARIEIAPRPNLAWHIHLDDVRLRGLVCDDELRRALPPRLAGIVAELDPQGPIDMDLAIDLKGAAPPSDEVTAQWWQRIRFQGNRLTTGITLEDVTGTVEIVQGEAYGETATVEGYVDLATVRALDVPLEGVRGPFLVDGNQISVGTPDAQNPAWQRLFQVPVQHSERNPYRGSQLRVERCYADESHEGKLGLNALVLLDPADAARTRYRVGLTLRDASLRAWAVDHQLPTRQLRGSVNGQVELEGHGTSSRAIVGNGWIQLSDAELFELPVFAQMLKYLNFKPGGKTAFNSGFGEFRVHDGLVDFSAIELSGDALRLVGKGTAEYAPDSVGRLRLDFYSKADDQFLFGLSQVLLLGPLFDNWVHVRVDGTMSNPYVFQQPGNPAQFLRELLNDVENLRRRLVPPGMMPPPAAPRSMGPRPPGR